MVRVGLDLRATEAGFKAHAGRGTGRYVTELTAAMEPLVRDQHVSLVPIYSDALASQQWEESLVQSLPFGRRTFESQVLFPKRLRSLDVDCIHFFSHGDAAAWSVRPQIVTVLDLIPLIFPELYKSDKSNLRFRFARYLEYRAIRAAQVIVAISESTKRDIVRILGVPESKILVTPLGVCKRFFVEHERTEGKRAMLDKQYSLPSERPLLLYVGGIDPRKNVPFLFDVMKELRSVCDDSRLPLLLLAGNYAKDDEYPKLKEIVRKYNLESMVKFLGFVDDELLPALYQRANLVVFPSLYEGFGLPVLEAMASQTAVIAANNSCIPEVLGTEGMLLPDNDCNAWVQTIMQLLGDSNLSGSLAAHGRDRARTFTWERTAKATLKAYSLVRSFNN